MTAALRLWRLLLPHHWVWACLSTAARHEQMLLDEIMNTTRDWPPTISRDAALLTPYLAGRVLEIGAGTGQTTALLVRYSFTVTALEPVYALWSRGRYVVPNARWEHVSWEDWSLHARYDTVVCAHTLHHIADRNRLAQKVGSWLCDGGRWLILEPRHSLRRVAHLLKGWWRDYRHMQWDDYGATHHFMTTGEIKHLATHSGMRLLGAYHGQEATLWVLER